MECLSVHRPIFSLLEHIYTDTCATINPKCSSYMYVYMIQIADPNLDKLYITALCVYPPFLWPWGGGIFEDHVVVTAKSFQGIIRVLKLRRWRLILSIHYFRCRRSNIVIKTNYNSLFYYLCTFCRSAMAVISVFVHLNNIWVRWLILPM